MSILYPSLIHCTVAATALKILLIPAYKSTDFEVHRNWLAITYSLPLREWYFEKTSEWTLDYPPFFAYFEWLLARFAQYVDPDILKIENLGYSQWKAVYFQRATVIISELVLVFALHVFVQKSPGQSKLAAHAAAISIVLSPGLLIIDHIHFQYNGFLYGILILSIVLAREQSSILLSGILFAMLLCLKHIYLYLAPAYFVYFLRTYCLSSNPSYRIQYANFVKLATAVSLVFMLAFGPFLYLGQAQQIAQRLFPFSRGLCHAYWAPNIWALYSFTDRVLISLAPYLRIELDSEAVNGLTRGLIGDASFAILPNITPRMTFALTAGLQIVCLMKLFLSPKPNWNMFVGAVVLCGYASFIFGGHVHEKAILLVIIPLSLLALTNRRYLGAFRPLAVVGHVSLFPLLFTEAEYPVKTIYTFFWLVTFLAIFDRIAPASTQQRIFLLDRFSFVYIVLSIPLIVYCSLFHNLLFGPRLEFLPLMFISSYCALGVLCSGIGFFVVYMAS